MTVKRKILLTVVMLLAVSPVQGEQGRPKSVLSQAVVLSAVSRKGDINGDKIVNVFDLLALLGQLSGTAPVNPTADVDGSGRTDVFDLLALLRELANPSESQEPFLVAATIGDHRLTDPVVHSFSQFDANNQVRDNFRIFSNRELAGAELILSGDTVRQTNGMTPLILEADPDTLQGVGGFFYYTAPLAWIIRAWDIQGECAVDSGVSRFVVMLQQLTDLVSYARVGEAIKFPLVLRGGSQRFGISPDPYQGTFSVDLNPGAADSVVFTSMEQLGEAVMAEVAAEDSLWHHTERFGDTAPTVFASGAVSRLDSLKACRLIIVNNSSSQIAVTPLDGNEALLTALGFPLWLRQSRALMNNENFILDPELYERYKSR